MRLVVAAFVAVFGLGVTTVKAGSVDLIPHRAVYSMDLASSQSGSGIVGAHGTMSYEFADACDGWIVENRLAVTYAYVEGGQVDTTTDFLTWESKDGLRYRFRLRNTRDGQITDEIEGTAEMKGKGQGGVAHYTRPDVVNMPLPKGTLFPTEHTRELVMAAQRGDHTLRRVVFDGSDTQGAFDVNGLIGGLRPVSAGISSPQLDAPSWPMRLAFFPLSTDAAEPDFEMAVDYHANGVATTIVQGFKSFSLVGHLDSVEGLVRHGC